MPSRPIIVVENMINDAMNDQCSAGRLLFRLSSIVPSPMEHRRPDTENAWCDITKVLALFGGIPFQQHPSGLCPGISGDAMSAKRQDAKLGQAGGSCMNAYTEFVEA